MNDTIMKKAGEYPYTRGIYPEMYKHKLWTMRQYAGFGNAEQTNKLFKYLIKQGQTGLSVAFDLPTQIGFDSDHPLSFGEVGKVGVAVDTLEDMEILFRGIDLGKISTSMTINSTAAIILAMYMAIAKKRGIPSDKLRGTVQNDILKEYIARGTYIFTPEPSMKLVTDIIEYCTEFCPSFNPISISGYHIREAGSTAAQEIGFTIANAIEYVKDAIRRGIDINIFGKRLSFFFSAHNDLLEEVAKFRAARRLWAKIMKNKFGVIDNKALILRFHTQTAGCTLTAQQPENNIVRVALQALASVLGGTQSLHTNSYDEALSLPSRKSASLALRIQQIIAYESGITNSVDPLGGSYYIEELTDTIESKALTYIDKIEDFGGVINAIENSYVQKEIQKSAYKYELDIENMDRIVVGINKFESRMGENLKLHKNDNNTLNNQIDRLNKVKNQRNKEKVKLLLQNLEIMARQKNNLIPVIIEAVENYCTVGEITNVLRNVYGEYKERVIF